MVALLRCLLGTNGALTILRRSLFFISLLCLQVPTAAGAGTKNKKPSKAVVRFTVKKATFVDDVQRLLTAAQAGKHELIELALTSTVGWGCPCPDFAHKDAYDLDLTETDEAYVKVVSAKGVSNIQEFHFAGNYRVRGYYTGQSAAKNKVDKTRLRQKKQTHFGYEFVATDWCYHAPRDYDPSECYLDDARKAGMRWCGAPIKELCRTLK